MSEPFRVVPSNDTWDIVQGSFIVARVNRSLRNAEGLARNLAVAVNERDGLLALREAAVELLEVADLRGDSDLPHPVDDPLLWSARMQTAWDELRALLEPDVDKQPEDATV